jgi:hypothetical protein
LVEDAIFQILQAADVPAGRAGWIAFALSYYVLGHVIEEQAQVQLSAAGSWKTRKSALVRRTDSSYARTALTATFDADPAERFDYGVRLFIDGVHRELLSAQPLKAD